MCTGEEGELNLWDAGEFGQRDLPLRGAWGFSGVSVQLDGGLVSLWGAGGLGSVCQCARGAQGVLAVCEGRAPGGFWGAEGGGHRTAPEQRHWVGTDGNTGIGAVPCTPGASCALLRGGISPNPRSRALSVCLSPGTVLSPPPPPSPSHLASSSLFFPPELRHPEPRDVFPQPVLDSPPHGERVGGLSWPGSSGHSV